MIQVAGVPIQKNSFMMEGKIENIIIQKMIDNPNVYSYQTMSELIFELQLRKNIIESARAMNNGDAEFGVFQESRGNELFWELTAIGGFQLQSNASPADAIRDIFKNSSLYRFECATAMIIILYNAVLKSLGDRVFDHLFQNLLLYSWHADPDLAIETSNSLDYLPGDIVYFNNPDFDPETPWWRGENAVALEDGTFFGHGIGIKSAEGMIETLNKFRKPWGSQSAYLQNIIVKPGFKHLEKMSTISYRSSTKLQPIIINHNVASISYRQYRNYLKAVSILNDF